VENFDDVQLSNEYFSPKKAVSKKDNKTINMFPVPYEYEVKVGNLKYKMCEVLIVWRIYIDGSAKPDLASLEKKKKAKVDDMVDLIS
jgi:hypothetical protein